ncbi:little elongation complex subunit 2 isoform 2-T2 [Discoglossus pictus]
MEGGELKWDIEPHNGRNSFFTRESYEKYSLGPTLAELCLLTHKTPVAPSEVPPAPKIEEKLPAQLPCKTEKIDVKPIVLDSPPLPEPRIPFPRYSSLNETEQRTYVQLMIKYMNKKNCFRPTGFQLKEYDHYMFLKSRLSSEHAEFQKFLQNSARSCVDDYNWLSDDAQMYTREALKACQTYLKNYPDSYTVHNITSILGGKFRTELSLKLEKCLLRLGSAPFVKVTFPTSELDLPTSSASSDFPPEKRAANMQESVISDPNVSKLAAKYSPHVVLTAQALYALLNNHGVNYKEQWEIPLRIETIKVSEDKHKKIVYLDSPLPKKEMSVREQNQMFHEVVFNLFTLRKSSVHVKAMHLDKIDPDQQIIFEDHHSKTQDVHELAFENDLTKLETFGSVKDTIKRSRNTGPQACSQELHSSPPDSKTNLPDSQTSPTDSKTSPLDSATTSPDSLSVTDVLRKSLVDKLKMEKQIIKCTKPEKEDDQEILELSAPSISHSLWSDTDDESSFNGFDSDEINELKTGNESSEEFTEPNLKKKAVDHKDSKPSCSQQPVQSDSEDDRLIIDTGDKKSSSKEIPQLGRVGTTTSHTQTQDTQQQPRKSAKRISKVFDPVGQILKMQTQLLKPEVKKVQEQSLINVEKSGQPTPLQPSTTFVPHPPMIQSNIATPSVPQIKESLLPTDLLACREDETAYTAPLGDNYTYKLFSLDDMLLMIRSRVQKAYTRMRAHQKGSRKHLPIYVLAKVNYQSCYGAESLTESESCRLWTESLLHSNCSFYVGHIDAFTSKLLMLEEITSEALKERIGNFKPANSLNILHHILKWVTDLQDGSYLLSHVAGDSSVCLYKSLASKNSRRSYNLHVAHSSLPKVPSSLSVPWVPLDPNILLPYHIHHGRPPCTFPPPPHGVGEKVKENKHHYPKVPKDFKHHRRHVTSSHQSHKRD